MRYRTQEGLDYYIIRLCCLDIDIDLLYSQDMHCFLRLHRVETCDDYTSASPHLDYRPTRFRLIFPTARRPQGDSPHLRDNTLPHPHIQPKR